MTVAGDKITVRVPCECGENAVLEMALPLARQWAVSVLAACDDMRPVELIASVVRGGDQ